MRLLIESSTGQPNPRLLLTGALARRSRASMFCWGRAAAPHAPAAEAQGVRPHPSSPSLRLGSLLRRFASMAKSKIDISQLSPAERIELLEALWDSLDPSEAAPITPELAEELERRSAEAEANPGAGRTWDEVHRDLKKRPG